MPKPKVVRYPQEAIASTNAYHAAPGRARDKLYGFYSARRERAWTSNVKTLEVFDTTTPMTPTRYATPRQALLYAKSHLPIPRDRRKR